MAKKEYASVDEYIGGFPADVREIMEDVRKTIRAAAPGATEGLSWSMPTYKMNKIIAQFAGHKNHLGFYPYPETIEHFRDRLSGYATSKGGIQFPYGKPVPHGLISEIVKYNAGKNS